MILHRFQHRVGSRANIGILLALLLACVPTLTLNAQQSGTAIVFYAQARASEDLWPDLLQSLRADLAAGSGELPNGFVLDQNPTFFLGNDDLATGINFSKVIEVKLLGRCDVLPQTYRPSLSGPLGWVLQVSGEIQPFVFVDCTRLAQVLRSTAAGLDKQGRRRAMTQAIAHVVIHEWIHIATQNPAHGARGITKQYLSVNDLIAEPSTNGLLIASH
jgi:hypothetical protein